MKSVLADLSTFDWEGDQPLYRPFRRSVIYEMHVAGFTRHPNSGVAPANRGTYLGVIEKIPYLQELGITAVELLPVYQFDAGDAPPQGHQLLGIRSDILFCSSSWPTAPAETRLAAWMSFEPW